MIDTSGGEPRCDVCGSYDVEWIDCERCGGDGNIEYDDAPDEWGEDCPSEPNHLIECPDCKGYGGYHFCRNGANHPSREAPEESRLEGRHDAGTL